MTFVEVISADEVWRQIQKHHQDDGIALCVGCLAGLMKTTPRTIHHKLDELEARGLIRQIRKIKNRVRYEIIDKKRVS